MSLKSDFIIWFIEGIKENGIRRRIVAWQVRKYLKEDFQMDGKKWYQSKSVWAAITGAVLGAIQPVSTAFGHPIAVPPWVYEVLGAFGIYAIRDGVGTPLSK